MNNEIIIDLSGIKNKNQILYKLGEVFEFDGSEESVSTSSSNTRKGWGLNWDALNDSLRYLTTGGIWGTSKKFELPLRVVFKNSRELQESEKESFNTLRKIFEDAAKDYELENKELIVEFK
jgi:RNAse (barnase) inhibitor barstar